VATNAELLAEARTARHNLVTGKLARVFMDQNGERVEFNKTSIADLDAYIRELELLVTPTTVKRPRPMGFTF
jgi:hypothetical protein